ncbi:ATP-grasp domain-containing protein [Oceanirhabdus sp. W0125-5]|uniref:ATP-grasp domain-containing protein n=1 Tax=Oceanirhabdus sp. W0125-5 TaxID=2999116 RepID=UPI0022F2AEC2|nr:ATP-grasp domain-containing protein [Oceanirhabdus sp. W0125-5]WBW95453.1 ATP-grasp domain-containing protein [Oceanirhabdus sp. W0125-5]
MNLLLTAIGKRIQLVKYLKETSFVVGIDCSELVPAMNFVDKFYKVDKYYEKGYIEQLIKICKGEKIDIIIPLYEKEFLLLSRNRKKFEDIGIKLMLSSEAVLNICNDKWKTYEFFRKNKIDTPCSYLKEQIERILISEERNRIKYPLIIKPRDGMGSKNVFKINNIEELMFFKNYVNNPIIQEFIQGKEYTIDVLCDFKGNIISIVPRERIEVRSGEVTKSKTVKNKMIIDKVKELCELLGGIGPLTLQCIVNEEGEMKFIEINPRFGGGVPLTFEAGVNYGKYLNMMINKKEIKQSVVEFEEITMLRYDEAVFI